MVQDKQTIKRETIFICKATPGDDDFVLWLAPKLEAAGYKVFADILSLEPSDSWRKKISKTLQNEAIKMLLCCRDSTLEKEGVNEEICIAKDLEKQLQDPRFIIPLRLEDFKKVFGIAGLQYIDFTHSWACGLRHLLDTLDRQAIPRTEKQVVINPNWENYKRRMAIRIKESPEVLTSNWLKIVQTPETIRYYKPVDAVDRSLMEQICNGGKFPAEIHLDGFLSFATPEDIEHDFQRAGKFIHSSYSLLEFMNDGCYSLNILSREAKNLVSSMFRKSWENFCQEKGLDKYTFANNQIGFHVNSSQVHIGKRIPWGKQGKRRSSMLHNISREKVWRYGVSTTLHFWPFAHFRLKSRVLFAESENEVPFDDPIKQHRLRRSICKGWRNKTWHGRLMAFLKLISEGSEYMELPLSNSSNLKIDAYPVLVESPVTTDLPDTMPEEAEEQDSSTLGNYASEEHI